MRRLDAESNPFSYYPQGSATIGRSDVPTHEKRIGTVPMRPARNSLEFLTFSFHFGKNLEDYFRLQRYGSNRDLQA
jgi:hypothetical protein